MSNSSQLENAICKVLLPMEEAGVDIDLNIVAQRTAESIDPDSTSPLLMRFSAIQHIKNVSGKLLAKRHDPVKKVEDHINHGGTNDDLFGSDLQPYYPVKRKTNEEKVEAFYVRKEELNDIDIELLATRMDKAGRSLQKHARALRAWYASKAA